MRSTQGMDMTSMDTVFGLSFLGEENEDQEGPSWADEDEEETMEGTGTLDVIEVEEEEEEEEMDQLQEDRTTVSS